MPTPSIDLRRIDRAKRLLILGVRPHLAAYTMGLPQTTVMAWHQQLTGARSNRGPLPQGAASYILNREDARRISIFAALYSMDNSADDALSVDHLIATLELYNRLYADAPIDGTLGWMTARELDSQRIAPSGALDSGIITLKYCPSCRSDYVYLLRSPRLRKCPFCKPKR